MMTESQSMEVERTSGSAREHYFTAWFNNRMMVVLMAVQSPKPMAKEALMRIRFFLEDIEHHFVERGSTDSIYEAFRYLETYFILHPQVRRDESCAAIEMIVRIYSVLGVRSHSLQGIRRIFNARKSSGECAAESAQAIHSGVCWNDYKGRM